MSRCSSRRRVGNANQAARRGLDACRAQLPCLQLPSAPRRRARQESAGGLRHADAPPDLPRLRESPRPWKTRADTTWSVIQNCHTPRLHHVWDLFTVCSGFLSLDYRFRVAALGGHSGARSAGTPAAGGGAGQPARASSRAPRRRRAPRWQAPGWFPWRGHTLPSWLPSPRFSHLGSRGALGIVTI